MFRRFYGQEEYRKLVEKLTDAAFFVYEDKGIGRAAARPLTDRNFRKCYQVKSSLLPAPMLIS